MIITFFLEAGGKMWGQSQHQLNWVEVFFWMYNDVNSHESKQLDVSRRTKKKIHYCAEHTPTASIEDVNLVLVFQLVKCVMPSY